MKHELTKLSFWELLGKTFMICARGTGYCLVITTVCYLPFLCLFFHMIFTITYDQVMLALKFLSAFFLFLAGYSIATGLMTLYTWQRCLGEKFRLKDSFLRVIVKILPLMVLNFAFLFLLVLCFAPILVLEDTISVIIDYPVIFHWVTMVGVLIFVLFLAAVVFSWRVVTVPVSLIERVGLGKIEKRCRTLLSKSRMKLLALCFIMTCLTIVYCAAYIVIYLVFEDFFSLGSNVLFLSFGFPPLFFLIFTPLYSVFSTLVYFNMRVEKEGLAVEQMSKVFSGLSDTTGLAGNGVKMQ